MFLKTITLLIVITFCCAFVVNIAKQPVSFSPGIRVVKKWDLPVILKEISGIATIDSVRFACVQDEVGSIFIYNTETSTIQEEIPFAPAGDYEGITLVNDTAWVLRADGKLFEVMTLYSKATTISEYSTPLTANHNVEGICYDINNNRLLLAIKNAEPGNKPYKGIYSFDLATKTMLPEPVFKIEMRQELKYGNKKRGVEIMPSGIAIHPKTKDIYLTDGRNSMLLVLDSAGGFKNLYNLNNKEFSQPEGIAFHSNGDLFISNEGAKSSGNILKVEPVQE